MLFRKCTALLGITFLLLTGCTQLGTPLPSRTFQVQTPHARQVALAKLTAWRMSGAFSIQQTGQKPNIANFAWRNYSGKNYSIEISSALGLYSISIHREDHNVTLWKNGTHPYNAPTPEGIMQQAMGWSLPISPLSSWMKGMPSKTALYEAQYDAYGHLTTLEQDGWTIKFSAYKNNDSVANVDFPQIILLQRPGMVVKIVVQDWFFYAQPDVISDAIT